MHKTGLHMGCINSCSCISASAVRADIALKLPNTKNCVYIRHKKKKWEKCDDINTWLQTCITKHKFQHWILYNDENSDKTHSNNGHSKGVVMWNDKSVSWLIHSVPDFPKSIEPSILTTMACISFADLRFPDIDDSQLIYGQSFVCLSNIGLDKLDSILSQLSIMKVHCYSSNYDLPALVKSDLETLNLDSKISHVSKSPKNEIDIYESYLAKNHGGKWRTQTWVRGHNIDDTATVAQIQNIKLHDINYTYKQDHSKWAVSDNGHVFIGDLNRMTSQFRRGGGGIVIKSDRLSNLFNSLIS